MGFAKNVHRVIRTLLVFIVAMSFFAQANWSSEEPQTRKHIVRSGESIAIIAKNYGFEVQELIQYNKLDVNSQLLAGQILYFPADIASSNNSAPALTAPVRPLNASQFPPDTAKPSPEEYYQLQEYMTIQGGVKPENNVDYNYIRKPAPVKSETALHSPKKADETRRGNASRDVMKEESIDIPEQKKEEDPEETIDDKASPALATFGDRPYAYFGNGEELVEVLKSFAASYYVPTIIAEDVQGEINGKVGPLTPVDFLDHLANVHGFIWYFDGHTLYVYNGNASEQKIISLSFMSVDKFKRTLKKVGIWDGRFFWKSQSKDGLVYISGPPRYIELVSQTALLLDEKEGDRQRNNLTVRMFRLKYAWATDKKFNFRGQELTVPGVASILQSIVSGGGVAKVTKTPALGSALTPVDGVSRSSKQEKSQRDEARQSLNAGAEADSVYINADPRLNAIIVHDLESKMTMYDELIRSLDKPTSQIEISVSIIDVNTDNIEALGVSWNDTTDNSNTEFLFNPDPTGKRFPSYSTIVQANIGAFNARLNLLADEGKVRIVSKPSILTLDNLEAILDNSSTFYVPVASKDDAELFPVTAGTVVQVTPRIVRETDGRRVHLSVNIQDGSGSQSEGQSTPRTTNSSLSTQAIVNESESLLIGGFYKEEDNYVSSKVPVLSDLPIFGGLFKTERIQKVRQVRLFLISPRIVGIDRG